MTPANATRSTIALLVTYLAACAGTAPAPAPQLQVALPDGGPGPGGPAAPADAVTPAPAPTPVAPPAPIPGELVTDYGVVAADHQVASAIGARVLDDGGNAIDAAVATALALGVANPASSGLGGGGFAVVYLARERRLVAYDFREVAPGALDPSDFVVAGQVAPERARRGGLAVGVPGEPAGLHLLASKHGVLGWANLVEPARALAAGGAPVSPFLARAADRVLGNGSGGTDRALDPLRRQLTVDGVIRAPGTPWVRADLAGTLGRLARGGARAFYRGPIADQVIRAVRAQGGVMTRRDLAEYQVVERAPLTGRWHGLQIATMPMPSSGGVVLLEALTILDDLAARAPVGPAGAPATRAATLHAITEALKHGFADRARYLGDTAAGATAAVEMLDPARLRALARAIDLEHTSPSQRYGVASPARLDDGGTSHLCVIDQEGNAVALTSTVNGYFGSKVITAGGVILNNQIDDFALVAGATNQFGLVQSAANLVGPGKRPLSSMTPTLLLDGDRVVGCVGGSGGPYIISSTLQVVLSAFADGLSAGAAVARPRVHHQWMPDELVVELGLTSAELAGLRRRGHTVAERGDREAVVQFIKVGPSGTREAASDPRKGGMPTSQLRPPPPRNGGQTGVGP
ncbi:MAG: gamma-glutamyltransferase [Kofleriaceae bacterium]|nr:gamma-glutamyltransferase [Kofleriaceae bacterium]MBP6837538.1 gamma-glutamyltransferase [Kofleriaceae bacterium]